MGLKSIGIFLVIIIFGFVFLYAGTPLAFNENEAIAKYMVRDGISEEEIEAILKMPRLVGGEQVYIAPDYRLIIKFNLDDVQISGKDSSDYRVCFVGKVLSDNRKK